MLPHLHLGYPVEEAEGIKTSWQRSVLLVLAITLHNIPEGLAVGIAFGALSAGLPSASLAGAMALALGVGIQNFPEGIAVSIPLRRNGEKPEELLPGAQSLISIGVALNRSAVCSGNLRLNRYDSMCVYERINHICLDTIRLLIREGARAISVSPYLPVDMGGESKGIKGDINHKTVAAVAGLGFIGLSRLLVTPEFGPFVRLGTIVTDAFLSPDHPLDENPCDQCELCRTACPVEAIREDGALDYRACASHALRSGLPGAIAIARKLIGADEKAIKGVIYSPDFWDIWQSAVSGLFYSCSECMASCPIGSD